MMNGFKDLDQVYVIAEIGNNHEGDFDLAVKMVELAAGAGASAVKFQTIKPECLVSSSDTKSIEKFRRFAFSIEQFQKLSQVAQREKVDFLSTPFDLDSVDAIDSFVPAYKVASGDNDFVQLIQKVASKNKPTIVSGGMADIRLLTKTKQIFTDLWGKEKCLKNLVFLHCVSSYPTPDDQANLNSIPYMRQELGCEVGYSDHTLGIEAAVAAVALGAKVIEKHFTLDKNHSSFRDHQLSATPEELKLMIERMNKVASMLGSFDKSVQSCEEGSLEPMRRSLVAKRDIEAKEKISDDAFIFVRPGGGISPDELDQLLGRELKQSIKKGQKLERSMFE